MNATDAKADSAEDVVGEVSLVEELQSKLHELEVVVEISKSKVSNHNFANDNFMGNGNDWCYSGFISN